MVERLVISSVLLHHMHPEAIAWPHALGGSGEGACGKLPFLVVFVAQGRVSGVPRALLLVHVGEGLASIMDDLVGAFQQVVNLIVHLELPVVLIHVADLALFIG